ncbi:MAG: hypothetical protein HY293_02515 [Planctomycetes bacterium]|nr:hypothetical protein [Planctomycetota bacterium]
MEPLNEAPRSVLFKRTPEEAEITLMQKPRIRRSRALVWSAGAAGLALVAATVAPVVALLMFEQREMAIAAGLLPLFGIAVAVSMVASEFNWEREGARIVIREKTLKLYRKGGIADRQWVLSSLWRVSVNPTSDADTRWALELMFRDGTPVGGEWKFRRLKFVTHFLAQYAEGWAKTSAE